MDMYGCHISDEREIYNRFESAIQFEEIYMDSLSSVCREKMLFKSVKTYYMALLEQN